MDYTTNLLGSLTNQVISPFIYLIHVLFTVDIDNDTKNGHNDTTITPSSPLVKQ